MKNIFLVMCLTIFLYPFNVIAETAKIYSVYIGTDNQSLTITGYSFETNTPPIVEVSGIQREILFISSTNITVDLTIPLTSGTHQVTLQYPEKNLSSLIAIPETEINLSKFSESNPLPFSLPGSLTWTHNLGGTPRFVQVYMRCKTPIAGYSVGDMILASSYAYDHVNYGGVGVIIDGDANIKVRNGNPIWIPRKDSGPHLAQPAHWDFVIRAWR